MSRILVFVLLALLAWNGLLSPRVDDVQLLDVAEGGRRPIGRAQRGKRPEARIRGMGAAGEDFRRRVFLK